MRGPLHALLIPPPGFGGRPRTIDLQQVVNAILYLARTGCAWRVLPKDFGPWSSAYHYLR
ncbi:MAG: transposase, partial [Planctomycetota bacterium]